MREDILLALTQANEEADFENSKNYVADGLLDSIGILNLVYALEEKFTIEIKGSDIVPENFDNLDSIERLVQSYVR